MLKRIVKNKDVLRLAKPLFLFILFLGTNEANSQTVTNGIFAGPETLSNVAAGWTITAGSPDLVTIPSVFALTYVAPGANVSSQGDNFQLLYEATNQASTEKMSQTITGFTIGTTYTLTYEEANFGPCYGGPCYTSNGEFLVNISGIAQMSSGNQMDVADNWYTVCLQFVATSTTHTLEFEANCLNTNGGMSGAWMALDNVQITTGTGGGGNADFSYPSSSVCFSSGSIAPSSITTPGGTFSATPGGLQINSTTGNINTNVSAPGVYTITYTLGGCNGGSSTAQMTIETGLSAGADNTTSICNSSGSTVDLNSILVGASTGGNWSETTTSGSFNPTTGVFDASGLSVGTYSFTYDVAPSGSCPGDQALFDVVVESTLTAGTDNAAQLCNGPSASIDLNTLLIGADAGGTFNELTASNAFNAATGILDADGLAVGVYSFTYSTSSASVCPVDVADFSIAIVSGPSIDVLIDEDVCAGDNLTPQIFSSDIAGSTINWTVSSGGDIGFGLSGTGDIGNFTAINGTSQAIVVTVDVSAVSPFGCVGNPTSFDITVHPLPEVSFTADATSGCEPFEVNFTNTTLQSANCEWDFGDGNAASGCFGISNTYTSVGQFSVQLEVTSNEGCTNAVTYTDYINVFPTVVAQFSFSPSDHVDMENPQVFFTNESQNASSYTWDFDDGSPLSTEVNPVHVFPSVGGQGYWIMLIANNQSACPDTAYQLIFVEDNIIFYVPNTFTPNDDEFNNVFQPVFTSGFDPYDFHFTIFNRWGSIVFESYDATESWDGSYRGVGLVPDGTYVWTVEFKELMSDKRHTANGHVNVLK